MEVYSDNGEYTDQTDSEEVHDVTDEDEGRQQYANKCELMLSLVGYAVGLGNIWRFPYLCYTYGGAVFLIPYFISLAFLGIPLFVLELGLGQMYRQGTLGVWEKMGRPRLQGIGIAATMSSFFVSLYYNVVIAWTIYYIVTTIAAMPSGILPWSDKVEGFTCPQTLLYINASYAENDDLWNGHFNQKYWDYTWCPSEGIPVETSVAPEGFVKKLLTVEECPARAAVYYWESVVLEQSSGLDELGGLRWGLVGCLVAAWVLVYFIIWKGVASSGKVVYCTALFPYVALAAFFIRAITLPNAMEGIKFFLEPDLDKLFTADIWLRAVTQIFYSLGVGFGSLIAFSSYNKKNDDFQGNAYKVSIINCLTSMFAGVVVFPVLGYLAYEMADVNPCIQSDNLRDLASIGLSGTGLAFIAFPIAISKMPFPFIWSLLFFVMILCLGIDSQFAMVESVMTVIYDAKITNMRKPALAAILCGGSCLLGLVFVTRGGIYWFSLFDYYSCVISMFFVTFMECFWLMWGSPQTFENFQQLVKENTGKRVSRWIVNQWKYTLPVVLSILMIMALETSDLMKAAASKPYPEGEGYLPLWSVGVGWKLGLLPVLAFAGLYLVSLEQSLDTFHPPFKHATEDEHAAFEFAKGA
eukprot:TRINITY_DN5604_c0_g1_i2.p1 TRINITY_DN5604_c0_g1~~TRINITY_DN5604_c0_g1_i2.p1  ORF type:complete len:638 (+),score=147.03 TRINITY_DN5604_c0_g1_i2:94-2007(+)